ncbi:hypothetical protein Tco_0553895 [Tanacetum coccineum]
MAGQLNMLYRDSNLARIEVMSLHTQVVAHQEMITELQAADRRRQAVITEMLVAEAVHKGTEAAEETSDSDDRVREIAGTRQRSYTAKCTRGG